MDYWRLKTKENFRLLALKVVAVVYERWLLTRGSKYGDFLSEQRWDLGTFDSLE